MKLAFHILTAGALLLCTTACKKQTAPAESYGPSVNWSKLETEFRDTSDAGLRASVASIKRALMYHQFPQAMVELDKMSSDPNLTESQKKAVSGLLQQTKEALVSAPSGTTP